jgi:glycerol-3-phosphate O-acyltransferase
MSTPRPVVEARNRLEGFNGDRDRILAEVQRRIMDQMVERAAAGGDGLEYVLNEVAYSEMRRLEGAGGRKASRAHDRWSELAHRLSRMSDEEKRERLEELVHHYARDIVGNFDARVYRFANDVLPPALSFLFSRVGSVREGVEALWELGGRVRVEGPIDLIRAACERGTIVVTPTHGSNMDSIVLGFGLSRSHLPPVTYGAGKNLFSNPFISFFMRNLGAYRVDRRLRFTLYKDVLKEYSTVLLENGYHSLFFPGGTRSRSNMLESHLKLGLLGTALKAYGNNLRSGRSTRRIYIVPVTINYRLVLEAETLIDDYLAETGQSRYIIEDDEFSRLGRIVEFLRKTLAHEGAVILRFGTPRDPFGNITDEDGESLDRRGRRVDPASYLRDAAGNVAVDPQRDAEYTRILGGVLAECFRAETVLLPINLVARVIFDAVAAEAGTRDIYRLLRLPESAAVVPLERVRRDLARLCGRIAGDPSLGRLDLRLADDLDATIGDALQAMGAYHTRPAAVRAGDRAQVKAMKLLYYYQNRTAHIPVEGAA